MKNQCKYLLKLLQKYKTLWDGYQGTWKMDPVSFESKNSKTDYSQPYLVPKVDEEVFKK